MTFRNRILFLSCLALIISCIHRSNEVKFRSGVVMQSGDVKQLARQDFFILKESVVSQWHKVLKVYPGADAVLAGSTAVPAITANPKYIALVEELDQKKKAYDETRKEYNSIVLSCIEMADANRKHGQYEALSVALWQQLSLSYSKYEDSKNGSKSFIRQSDLLEDAKLYSEIQAVKRSAYWQEQVAKARRIADRLGLVSKRLNEQKFDAGEIQRRIDSLRSSLAVELVSSAKNEFYKAFVANTISTIKTNLDGEATVKINNGDYYIFGFAKIGTDNIIWDHAIKVDDDNKYFEIANDNALAISQKEEGMVQLFNALFLK